MNTNIDAEILKLIPHRPPMLLIERLLSVAERSSSASLVINSEAHFYQPGLGVPAWVGLEYMGQTAALIAGYQQRQGLAEPHLGFLLGCRSYSTTVGFFNPDQKLIVFAEQAALVGESLATFNCTISDAATSDELAHALLSVFRQPLNQQK
jgi:predicted hotdog family 3-hydroxylacyl-ACP dehydratase